MWRSCRPPIQRCGPRPPPRSASGPAAPPPSRRGASALRRACRRAATAWRGPSGPSVRRPVPGRATGGPR
ncbi:MAG TPA: hypothetical protein DD490_00885 [Acidobacteria bacterium]|nr:hypothetical protein [Acidobacteriota bacterium]